MKKKVVPMSEVKAIDHLIEYQSRMLLIIVTLAAILMIAEIILGCVLYNAAKGIQGVAGGIFGSAVITICPAIALFSFVCEDALTKYSKELLYVERCLDAYRDLKHAEELRDYMHAQECMENHIREYTDIDIN